MKYRGLNLNTENHLKIHGIFQIAAKGLLPKIKEINDLIDTVTKSGEITVNFVPSYKVPSGAMWHSHERLIEIDENLPFLEILESIMFELHNANNKRFDLININNFKTAEEFAQAEERAEYYGTTVPHQNTLTAIFLNKQYKSLFEAYGCDEKSIQETLSEFYNTFEDWSKAMDKPLKGQMISHTDIYRKQFAENQKQKLKQDDKLQTHKNEMNELVQKFTKENNERWEKGLAEINRKHQERLNEIHAKYPRLNVKTVDVSEMTEEEQIQFAINESLKSSPQVIHNYRPNQNTQAQIQSDFEYAKRVDRRINHNG